jgi:glycosyltransferase involved in cell wall biosynthesis
MANYNRIVHNLFFNPSLTNADRIITMSENTKKSIVEYFNIEPSKITVIYEGVDEKFKPYDKKEVISVLSHYAIERPYLLAVGTLEPKKNYIKLLKAYKALKTDLDLVIVGKKGWKADDIFKTIEALGLKERVKLLGYIHIDDLPYLYNGAEIFVFPSLYEGFGLPLLEAMACGVPVVCSNTSSLDEISGDAALKFNPESTDEIVSQIKRLINDNELQDTLHNKGAKRAKLFSWDKTAQQTLAVLKGK